MKMLQVLAMAFVAVLLLPVMAFAEGPTSVTFSGSGFGAGIGAALTIVGAGLGFGKLGAAALESMSRQPEVAGRIQTAMIILAALLEGVTLFALVVCITVAGKANF